MTKTKKRAVEFKEDDQGGGGGGEEGDKSQGGRSP
jgi:hypothetical protein